LLYKTEVHGADFAGSVSGDDARLRSVRSLPLVISQSLLTGVITAWNHPFRKVDDRKSAVDAGKITFFFIDMV
jgi:hypothetical protein